MRIRPENIGEYLDVHEQSLSLASHMIGIIGREDAEAFVRIVNKILADKSSS